jgi:hypothetical protein
MTNFDQKDIKLLDFKVSQSLFNPKGRYFQ